MEMSGYLTQVFLAAYNYFMPLSKKDLQSIRDLVHEAVEQNNSTIFDHIDDTVKQNNSMIFDHVDTSIKKNNDGLIEQVKDIVDFAVEKSEIKLGERIDKLEESVTEIRNDLADFRGEMGQEISDIAEMNREFLAKIENHEGRINKLELKSSLVAK